MSVSASFLPTEPTFLKFTLVFPPGINASGFYTETQLQGVFSDTFFHLSHNVKNPNLKKLFREISRIYNTSWHNESLDFEKYGNIPGSVEASTKSNSVLIYLANLVTSPFGVSQYHTNKEIAALRAWIFSPGNQANKTFKKSYEQATSKYGKSEIIRESFDIRLIISCTDSVVSKNCSAPNELSKAAKGTVKEVPGVIKDYAKSIPWAYYIGAGVLAIIVLSTMTASATITAKKGKDIL